MLTDAEPSHIALTAAAARAAHLLVDHEPYIFADALAETLLGERAQELIRYHRRNGEHPVLAGARAQVTCRTRYTEDRVAAAGADQYVLLGAGLDSFAYRSTVHMRVFEVDHPATQEAKRRRLAAAGIAQPAEVSFVPVDFERTPLPLSLARSGFEPTRPAVVSWLGVSMYLTRAAITRTLSVLGRFAPGSELVLDYFVPEELRDDDGRTYAELVAPVAAERGEPWLTFFSPEELTRLLREQGFTDVRHVGQRDIVGMLERSDALRPSTLAMIAHARI